MEEAKINPTSRLQAVIDSDIFLVTVAVAREERVRKNAKNLGEYMERLLIQVPEIRSRLSILYPEKLAKFDEKYQLGIPELPSKQNREKRKNPNG